MCWIIKFEKEFLPTIPNTTESRIIHQNTREMYEQIASLFIGWSMNVLNLIQHRIESKVNVDFNLLTFTDPINLFLSSLHMVL